MFIYRFDFLKISFFYEYDIFILNFLVFLESYYWNLNIFSGIGNIWYYCFYLYSIIILENGDYGLERMVYLVSKVNGEVMLV